MEKKIKVLFLGKNPPPYYGVSIWFEQLQAAQWPANYEMLWFHTGIHTSIATLGKTGLIPLFRHISLHFSFFFFLWKHKPDIIVIPISQSLVGYVKDSIFILLSSLFKGKTLVMLHGSNFKTWVSQSGSTTQRFVKFTLNRCFGAIVLGEKLKYIFAEYFSMDKIFVAPNGVEVKTQKATIEKNDVPVLCNLGNLIPAKGVFDILNALCILEKDKIKYKMNFIGGWPEKEIEESCKKIAKDNHLNAEFLGVKTGLEKQAILRNADVFIFTPNKPEGLPYVIIEAMANGLPVIVTDQGAITEAVSDGINGFIVESKNSLEIAEKASFLIHNPDRRQQMGKKSFEIYNQKFTSKKMAENFQKIFSYVSNR